MTKEEIIQKVSEHKVELTITTGVVICGIVGVATFRYFNPKNILEFVNSTSAKEAISQIILKDFGAEGSSKLALTDIRVENLGKIGKSLVNQKWAKPGAKLTVLLAIHQ